MLPWIFSRRLLGAKIPERQPTLRCPELLRWAPDPVINGVVTPISRVITTPISRVITPVTPL